MYNPTTQEEIDHHITAAFHSVDVINTISGSRFQDLTEEERQDFVDRNKAHLQGLMGETWFVENLTPQQQTDINAVI